MSDLWNSEPGGSGGASAFISLSDVPASYAGQAGKAVAVNGAENALEFITFPAGYTDAEAVAAIKADADWNATDWDTAFSWGNHALAGYLTVESDPVFTASQAFNIDAGDITNLSNLSGVNTGDQDLSGYQLLSAKGVANGYASLDSGGKVPIGQLPSSIMEYKGVWNASTNTPTLADGSGDTGDVYRVSVAGSQDLGSGSISFSVGDYVIYNGSTWEKSDTTDAVATVFGRTGNVTAQAGDYTKSDVGLGNVENTALSTWAGSSNLITVGTLTGGGTGAGFTIALGTSTLTGDLPFANLTQITARSVLGVTGNSTADVAAIQGTTDQVLRVNGAGTALAFGAIDLSKSAAATGVLQAASFPALTGDITTVAGALATTLKNTGTAGTYRSVTTDAQGRVTAGTNPTTFSGYGISDTSANLAAAITDETGSGALVFGTSPTFTTGATISGTAPSLVFTDTTASAKSLTIAVDANIADLRESAAASGSLLTLDLANNRVGVGIAAPTAPFHVQFTSGSLFPIYDLVANDAFACTVAFRKARGTPGSLSAVQNGDVIGAYQTRAYDGSGYVVNSALRAKANGTIVTGFVPTDLEFINMSGSASTINMVITANGNIVAGAQSALSTSATDGFVYIPDCAGTPTGAPTAYTGKVAMVYDTTNNKLYIRNGAAWKSATFA